VFLGNVFPVREMRPYGWKHVSEAYGTPF